MSNLSNDKTNSTCAILYNSVFLDLFFLLNGTIIQFSLIKLNNKEIELGEKSPTIATTDPSLMFRVYMLNI